METKTIRKKASLKKIASNRRNARLSTGPRTPGGKRRVRWNALRHGLLAREIFIPREDTDEEAAQFERMFIHLRRDLRPQGTLEEVLVEKIAVDYWRLRRLLHSETGEIRKALDQDDAGRTDDKLLELSLARNLLASAPASARIRLRESSLGLEYLKKVLAEVQQDVEKLGYFSEQSDRALAEHFGEAADGLAARCRRLSPPPPSAQEPDPDDDRPAPTGEPGPPPASPSDVRPLIQLLAQEIAALDREQGDKSWDEFYRHEAHTASLHVPTAAVPKLVLYENNIERQLQRHIRQLERLQKLRMARKGRMARNGKKDSFSTNKAKQVV